MSTVTISSARWEGQKAVVEGTWKGERRSPPCTATYSRGPGTHALVGPLSRDADGLVGADLHPGVCLS